MKRFLALLLVLSASAAYGEIYTWKDARGTVFYTNSINEIPARYLKKARVYDVATGRKGALATDPSAALPGAPAATPGPAPVQQASPVPTPTPVPVMPQPAGPAALSPASPGSPAPEVASPRSRPTRSESRSQRRAERRRDYSVPEEE